MLVGTSNNLSYNLIVIMGRYMGIWVDIYIYIEWVDTWNIIIIIYSF